MKSTLLLSAVLFAIATPSFAGQGQGPKPGSGGEQNSAKEYAPGQRAKEEAETAKENAPGQQPKADRRESIPGQIKKPDDQGTRSNR